MSFYSVIALSKTFIDSNWTYPILFFCEILSIWLYFVIFVI